MNSRLYRGLIFVHRLFIIFICMIIYRSNVYGLRERVYSASPHKSQAGALSINLHSMPVPSTTQLSHESAEGQEWISMTVGNYILERHNGSREVWTPPSFTGYPSTQFTGKKFQGVSYSDRVGIPTDDWDEGRPPASGLDIGYTSYSIHGGNQGSPIGSIEDMNLGDNSFFVQSPSYLRFVLPGCPNFTPASDDLTGDCPTRVVPPGEWKFSIIGLLSGTNINGLKDGRALPTTSYDYELPSQKDIANYTTFIYSTILDIGAMGESVQLQLEFSNGTSISLAEVSNTTNIVDAKLKIKGVTSESPITISFVKYYGTGTYTRNVDDFVCTQEESYAQGSTFGECTRDVTEMADGYDGKPYGGNFPTAAKGTAGDPEMVMTEIKEMKVTIRSASCENRPATPSESWPEGDSIDCPWWYKSFDSQNNVWSVDDESDPLNQNPLTKDQQIYCESGFCYHIDFHFDLGNETLAERTVLGNPDNAITYGIEEGTFFIYDPTVDGGDFKGPINPIYLYIAVAVALVAVISGVVIYRKKRTQSKNASQIASGINEEETTPGILTAKDDGANKREYL